MADDADGLPTAGKVASKQSELALAIMALYAPDGASPGAQLPTERRLAEEFSVTRTAIRNALGHLEADGRISREVGRGTFLLDEQSGVRQAAVKEAAPPHDDIGPVDVIAARRVVEMGIIPFVITRATERDFREIERCRVGCENAATGDEYKSWDLAFHRAIVHSAHSPLMVRLYAEIEEARQGAMWQSIRRRADSAQTKKELKHEHAAIVSALSVRDIDGAECAVQEHIDNIERNMLRSLRRSRVRLNHDG